jgi:ATP-binding cassette subfamily B protein
MYLLNKRRKYSIWGGLCISFIAAPYLSAYIAVQSLITAIVPTLQIMVSAWFIDESIRIISQGAPLVHAAPPIVVLVLFIAYRWVIDSVMKLAWIRLSNRLKSTYRVQLVEKCARLRYSYIENNTSLDVINRVMQEGEDKICDLYKMVTGLLGLIIRIIGIIVVIMSQVWWAAIVMLVISVPLMILSKKSGDSVYKVSQEVTEFERKYEYLGDVLRGREASHERNVYRFSDILSAKWREIYDKSSKLELRAFRNWYIKLEVGSTLTAIVSVFCVIVLLHPVIAGTLSIGIFLSLTKEIFSLIDAMSWELRNYVDSLAKLKGYMGDLKTFVQFDEIAGETEKIKRPSSFSQILFENVSFRYPGTDRDIVNNLSFSIEKGKHYSFVGKNGEGKSTIIKLMLGLYDNYEGSIKIDGAELRDMDSGSIKGYFSVAFQDFAMYEITLRENLQLGSDRPLDEKQINEYIQSLSLEEIVSKLPNGVDTSLGRISQDGLDVSGGEWQRIALARSFASGAPVRILDEPTAALDPIMESRVYNDFSEISRDKTTITISHRLGATRSSNVIFVLEGGSIIEKGTIPKARMPRMFGTVRLWRISSTARNIGVPPSTSAPIKTATRTKRSGIGRKTSG